MKAALVLFLTAASLTAADLSGTVVAEHDGSPIVSAAISLRSGGKVVAELETDGSGVFKTSMPAGDYTVTATKASYLAAEQRVALAEAGESLTIQITKLGVISGRVTDNQGNGVRNMVVAAIPAPTDGGPIPIYNTRPTGAATDANGRYRVFGLPPGNYAVALLAGNARSIANVSSGLIADTSRGNTGELYPSTTRPSILPIRGGEEHKNIDFRVNTGALYTIRGTVSGPNPETPYRVMLVAEGMGISLGEATAPAGKEFQFTRVAPGTYKIFAARQNIIEAADVRALQLNGQTIDGALLALANTQRVEPAFGETTVTVSTQDVTGVTISARPGNNAKVIYQPAPGCPEQTLLLLNPLEFAGTGSSSRPIRAGTEVAINGMPPVTFTATVNLPAETGCYAALSPIDFRRLPSEAIPIVVSKLGAVHGKVDTTGHKPEEFQIVLTAPDGFTRRTLMLDKNAQFSVPNLRPGRYRVSAVLRTGTRTVAADQDIAIDTGATAEVAFPALP